MQKKLIPLPVLGFLAFALGASSLTTAKADETATHTLSEWNLGTVIQGETYTQDDLKGKVVVIEDWGVN